MANLKVECPHCHRQLEVEPATGKVVAHAEAPKPKKSMAELLAEQEQAKAKRSQAFQQSVEQEKGKSQRLREQVQKTLETIKPEDIKPETRDIDLD